MPGNISLHEDVDIADAAAFLGASAAHVQRLIHAGILPATTSGQEARVPRAALAKYRAQVDGRHAALDELAADARRASLYDGPPGRFVR